MDGESPTGGSASPPTLPAQQAHSSSQTPGSHVARMVGEDADPPSPQSLIAELTHRCPLHCLYCSNPVQLQQVRDELTTADWRRAFEQAARLGVLHLHLTGGEPLARHDLAELVSIGHAAGLYTNLITSGIGLTEERLRALAEAGLEHLQLSFQDANEASANHIAGARAHAHKLTVAKIIRKFPFALTINLVVHRMNLDRLEEMITMAEECAPDRLEIAHVQYYGWAFRNRSLLMPTAEQVEQSLSIVERARDRLRGNVQLNAVTPDYFANFPKPCVGGWGRQMMLIDPAGNVLPCHAASVVPGLKFDSVRDHDLGWIWQNSAAFNQFRGEEWMPATCRSCERRARDFGGCRCQALMLTGDANAIDPACVYSPHHSRLIELRSMGRADEAQWRGFSKGGAA